MNENMMQLDIALEYLNNGNLIDNLSIMAEMVTDESSRFLYLSESFDLEAISEKVDFQEIKANAKNMINKAISLLIDAIKWVKTKVVTFFETCFKKYLDIKKKLKDKKSKENVSEAVNILEYTVVPKIDLYKLKKLSDDLKAEYKKDKENNDNSFEKFCDDFEEELRKNFIENTAKYTYEEIKKDFISFEKFIRFFNKYFKESTTTYDEQKKQCEKLLKVWNKSEDELKSSMEDDLDKSYSAINQYNGEYNAIEYAIKETTDNLQRIRLLIRANNSYTNFCKQYCVDILKEASKVADE